MGFLGGNGGPSQATLNGSDSTKNLPTGDAGGSAAYQTHHDIKFLKDMILDERNKRENGL